MKFYGQSMSKDPRDNIQYQGVGAMHGMNLARGDYSTAQRHQLGALGMYEQAAMGQGPSAAGAMLQQGSDQAMANAQALASQGRGGNLQAANQAAVNAGLAASNQATHAAAQQAAADQQAGMQGYAAMGNAMAGQALGQQGMFTDQQNALLGMQLSDDQHRRQMAQQAREWRTNRNMGWAQFGTQTGMGVLEGIFGGMG